MKYAVALSALAAAATCVSAQTPDGCSSDYTGYFEFNPVPISGASKRDVAPLHKRQTQTCTSEPYSTLKGGVLTDQCERTGEIVANAQFQYDLHLQNNAINTGGFSICTNNTLAIAGSAVFYHCLSGTFYNLYDASLGAQCSPVYLEIIGCTPPADAGSDCPAGTPTSVSSSTSPSSISSTSVASVPSSTSGTSPAITPAAVAAPANAVLVVSMPYTYTSSNATASATATGTGVVTPGSTGTAKTSPIAFHGGAASLAMGGKLLVSAVAIAALAFLA
ncbi:hypothetical protein HO133_008938 [Letharia lupina]|uniref:Cell wall mannoprotein PIR1-like C-terminal domain-containing protein n=1 Tax=Letharia lupina TaxID=560253 RepID=A0A8H6CMQ1_9LECA|nr:uncharacterized protein HO133_008938 [Letharia lupina]KAF6226074.1 hypothetical protein HO133_008938 [Letharia lupina]